ncbi:hypothetical protein GCM10010193_60820 [Kitasatospora atroaurantiaca]
MASETTHADDQPADGRPSPGRPEKRAGNRRPGRPSAAGLDPSGGLVPLAPADAGRPGGTRAQAKGGNRGTRCE